MFDTQRNSQTVEKTGESGSVYSPLTVYYDGSCALCKREIDFYRSRDSTKAIEWVNVAETQSAIVAPDLLRTDALKRFHVRLADGRLVSGPRGFGALWAVIPGFSWLAPWVRFGALQPILELLYFVFLRIRPILRFFAGTRVPCADRPRGID